MTPLNPKTREVKMRPEIEQKLIEQVLKTVKRKIEYRLTQKGRGIFISSHETLGILSEEFNEFGAAVQSNDPVYQTNELLDVAVAAVLGLTSIESGEMDW